MLLTKENYFSPEAGREFMSVSQFKEFIPELGGCEARAKAKYVDLSWVDEEKDALLIGKYVHAWNEGNLMKFQQENPSLYKKDGTIYAKFEVCGQIIATLENDPIVTMIREGQKEVIMTAELFGIPWKIMADIYNPDEKRIVDLKCMKSFYDKFWNNEDRYWMSFIEKYGYDLQMAVYAEIEARAKGRGKGDYCEPYLLAVTKEDPPDKEVIGFGAGTELAGFIENKLDFVAEHIKRVVDIKAGKTQPMACGRCAYCRSVKQIKGVKHYTEFDPS